MLGKTVVEFEAETFGFRKDQDVVDINSNNDFGLLILIDAGIRFESDEAESCNNAAKEQIPNSGCLLEAV